MLNPTPQLRFTDPCLFATFGELFADMPGTPREKPVTPRDLAARRKPRLLKLVAKRG